MVAKLGQDKPVTFESLKRFKQPDVYGRWFHLTRTNVQSKGGFDSALTIGFSKFKPLIEQMPSGLWKITFEVKDKCSY